MKLPRGVQATTAVFFFTTAVFAPPKSREVGPAGSSPVPWGRRCVCGGGSNNRCGSLFAGRPRGRPRHNRQLSPYSTRQGRDTREDGARRPSQVSPEDRRRAPTTGAIRGPGPHQREAGSLSRTRSAWRISLGLPELPALLFWWRLPEFPLEHRRRRGLRVYLSPAFRGNRNVTVGREALICFALFSFLSMPCIIMIGHGAHRRQGGSQLAAEPACSRRVRAPSETWGDGCSQQVGEATTRRVTWAWGWFDFVSPDRMHALGKLLPPPCPTPPAAHQLGRADKHETVSREGSGRTFL